MNRDTATVPTTTDGRAVPSAAESESLADSVPGSALSALTYNPILWLGERAGMAQRRRRLLAEARGDVLEIGAGTGLNLPYYPTAVDRLVLTEPQADMAKHLRRRLDSLGRRADVVRAPAGALPFADDSFDTVVGTLVLCTVDDPEQALGEAARVLRDGGSLLFLEHVRADSARLAGWQDRLSGPWKSFADGCNCNRDTARNLRNAGFEIVEAGRDRWRWMPRIVQPLIAGRALPPAR